VLNTVNVNKTIIAQIGDFVKDVRILKLLDTLDQNIIVKLNKKINNTNANFITNAKKENIAQHLISVKDV